MDPSRDDRNATWFVLSVEGDTERDLRGTLESTRGDVHVRFASGHELLEILSGARGKDAPDARSTDRREAADA